MWELEGQGLCKNVEHVNQSSRGRTNPGDSRYRAKPYGRLAKMAQTEGVVKKRKQEVIVLDETFTLALKLPRTIKNQEKEMGKGVA